MQSELGNYQTRMNDLTNASQKLAGASQGLVTASDALVKNAGSYVAVGRNIDSHIELLNTTQEELLIQMKMVAGGICTASHSMSTASSNMVQTTTQLENLTKQLNQDMQT